LPIVDLRFELKLAINELVAIFLWSEWLATRKNYACVWRA